MYIITGQKDRNPRWLLKTLSVLLILAVGLVNTPLSFAFTIATATFSASATVVGGTDSDGDDIPDEWEEMYGLDPTDPDDADDDPDNDGLSNLEEYRMRTDPTVSNSGIIATLTATPSEGPQPLEVLFTAEVTGNVNPIIIYEWDFDGSGTYDQWTYAGEGNTVTYTYTASGSYNAKLRATDTLGNAGTAYATVNVTTSAALSPPTVTSGLIFAGMVVPNSQRLNATASGSVTTNAALSPPTVTPELNFVDISIPETQRLNATASDNEGITRYQWDTTGNGEYDVSLTDSADITRTYNEVFTGSFNASVRVTDTDGLSDIATVGISSDASSWDNSPYRPRVFLNRYVVYGTAGVPVYLGGYGMPQMGNDYGYAKKLEWDFEGDGIYDWTNTLIELENNIWTMSEAPGRADVTHTYGAPGIYRAVLKVHTDANLSATNSALVIISANGTPPTARATVTFNGTAGVTEIDGVIPIKASFDHSLSSGSIVKYEWDFDGDKRIDYSTASSTDIPTYYYSFPGYYVACLRVTDSNGLIDTFYIPVFAYYPASYSSCVKEPSEGLTVAGNAITLTCKVFPDDTGVDEVIFQYRREGDSAWTDIGPGAPVLSYMISWDTTLLENGATYQLRAVVNGEDSDLFKIASVVVDNLTSSPDIYESKNGTHTKRVIINPEIANSIVLPDGTYIDIPALAVSSNGSLPQVSIEEVIGPSAGVGNSIEINITGTDYFQKDITISMPYPDENNDGIVDGTGIDENTLVVKWLNPDINAWEPLYDSIIYTDENYVSARINHMSLFGVGPLVTTATVTPGISTNAAASGGSISYCFIATAAYGTPMAEDVIALRAFRDRHLMRNGLGREFVSCYYRYSPPIAKYISDKPALRAIVRFLLRPLVKIAKVTVGAASGRE